MTEPDSQKAPRLYVPDADFAAGKACNLADAQAHYLRNVMRASVGDHLRLFNGRDGEWLAEIQDVGKKAVSVSLLRPIRPQIPSPDILVLASPVKKEAFDFMVEKSCELGAAAFQPVICDHTVVHRANEERLQAVAIEAAEQCERTDIMVVHPLADLKTILHSWDKNRELIFCLEREEAVEISQRLKAGDISLPLAILVGPEGGFSRAEIQMIRSFDFVRPVSLGGRILRAETALIAGLSCIQSALGDWAD